MRAEFRSGKRDGRKKKKRGIEEGGRERERERKGGRERKGEGGGVKESRD